MRKLYLILFAVLITASFGWAAHEHGPFGVDRVITGSNNQFTDPNPTADYTGANDNYITNDTSGVWQVSGSRFRIDGNLHIAGEIAELDSILGAIVFKSTLKVIGATTLSNVSADSILSAIVAKSTLKVIGGTTLSNITAIDSIISAVVLKSTLKVIGGTTLTNITSIDSIISAIILKSTLKVIGGATLSNITSIDSIISAFTCKSTVKTLGTLTANHINMNTSGIYNCDTLQSTYANVSVFLGLDTIKADPVITQELTVQGDVQVPNIDKLDTLADSWIQRGNITLHKTDTLKGPINMRDTLVVSGSIGISGNIDSVNNITAIDSIISALTMKSTLKVVGGVTMSNITAVDSIISNYVSKGNVKVVGKIIGANGDSISNDTATVWRIGTTSGRTYINAFRYPVIDWGENTTTAGLGKDTAIFARSFSSAPSVVVSPKVTYGADTLITLNIDSITTTAAFIRYIVTIRAVGDSNIVIDNTSNKVVKWDWHAIGN